MLSGHAVRRRRPLCGHSVSGDGGVARARVASCTGELGQILISTQVVLVAGRGALLDDVALGPSSQPRPDAALVEGALYVPLADDASTAATRRLLRGMSSVGARRSRPAAPGADGRRRRRRDRRRREGGLQARRHRGDGPPAERGGGLRSARRLRRRRSLRRANDVNSGLISERSNRVWKRTRLRPDGKMGRCDH